MKHIIALIFLSAPLLTVAQTIHLSGQVFWPDGGLMEYPMTLHIEREGCPLLNAELAFTGGTYSFDYIVNPLLCQDSVRIYLSGEAKAREGVTTLDLVKLVKQLLGFEEFTTVLQQIAGDANNSWSLSALDLIEIRKVVLGIYPDWPNGKSLNFFVKNSATAPPIGATLQSVQVLPPEGGTVVIDFWGVKKGELGHF